MSDKLRIIVADISSEMHDYFREILPQMGHELAGVVESGRELVERCRALRPDLVISDCRLSDMKGTDAAKQIYETEPVPIIHYCQFDQPLHPELELVLTHLVKPVGQVRLAEAIGEIMVRFKEFKRHLNDGWI